MSALDICRPRAWSPAVRTRVNQGHPLAVGLVGFLLPNVSCVDGGAMTPTVGITSTPFGRAAENTAYGPMTYRQMPGGYPSQQTVMGAFQKKGAANPLGGGIVSTGTTTPDENNSVNFDIGYGGTNFLTSGSSATVLHQAVAWRDAVLAVPDGPVVVVAQRAGGNLLSSWFNNVPATDVTVGIGSGNMWLFLGVAHSAHASGVVAAVACWNRWLSESERAMVSTDPFCMLEY